jgi:hypothetical protein
MTKLDEAVEALYATFARYPRPEIIEFCPCGCTKPGATDHLVAVPLRELCFADLIDYCGSAMTTQGTVDDFRYLLPRLFQGVANEPFGSCPEFLFGDLKYAEWKTWPREEIMAVKSYLDALWRKGLRSFPLDGDLPAFSMGIEELLDSIAQTGEPLEPYLQTWTETKTQEADEHLIQFVTMHGDEFSDGQTLNEAFWKNSKPQAGELRRWILHADTLQRIANVTHLLRKDGYEHRFAPAFQVLLDQSKLR